MYDMLVFPFKKSYSILMSCNPCKRTLALVPVPKLPSGGLSGFLVLLCVSFCFMLARTPRYLVIPFSCNVQVPRATNHSVSVFSLNTCLFKVCLETGAMHEERAEMKGSLWRQAIQFWPQICISLDETSTLQLNTHIHIFLRRQFNGSKHLFPPTPQVVFESITFHQVQ